jgi:hypothetical protein
MTDLYVVRSQQIPVEQLAPGQRIILPNGREVTIERVEEHERDDDTVEYIVRWWRPAERGEPGYPRHGAEPCGDEYDGRYLGSLIPVPAGHLWSVAA